MSEQCPVDHSLLNHGPNESCEVCGTPLQTPTLHPRRFVLNRHEDETGISGTGIVAWGVRFPDGVTVTHWGRSKIRQTCVWQDVSEVAAVHGHGGKTEIVWID